jgi:hypothetical protein
MVPVLRFEPEPELTARGHDLEFSQVNPGNWRISLGVEDRRGEIRRLARIEWQAPMDESHPVPVQFRIERVAVIAASGAPLHGEGGSIDVVVPAQRRPGRR